jgi:Na+/melibiose symporter-like transporter
MSANPDLRFGASPALAGTALRTAELWRYGLLGLPLAFASLPLYVILPAHYARDLGVPLGALGLVLFAARSADAFIDPALGRWIDRGFDLASTQLAAFVVTAGVLLALAFWGLMLPPAAVRARGESGLLAWLVGTLALTMVSFSFLSILHQAWGARWGGGVAQRLRVNAARESMAAVGVVAASVLPLGLGLGWTCALFALALGAGVTSLLGLPTRAPGSGAAVRAHAAPAASPWRVPAFRRLYAIYVINGVAGAIPACTVLFFIRDRLQAPAWAGACLALYFLSAVLSMPLWSALVRRWGVERAWLSGMGLALAAFVWTATLGAGDVGPFAAVCVATGVALAADLVLPATLLNGLIEQSGDARRAEGRYWGWWNVATKFNLALAAGIVLPLLSWAGYVPGSTEPHALAALVAMYVGPSCLFKALAAWMLLRARPRAVEPHVARSH